MSLKQLFKRYLKETNLYGKLFGFLGEYCGMDYYRVCRALENIDVRDLFWVVCHMSESYKYNWYYSSKTLFDFVNDWCEFKNNINNGDIITAKTLEGKYEFEYTALRVLEHQLEVETLNHAHIKFERITKINGKEFNFSNGWEFKRNF